MPTRSRRTPSSSAASSRSASAAGYDEAISRVVTGLTTAAAAQPADAAALGALSDDVQTYTSLVEQARSNNRLGLPVGAQYLKEASAGLRTNAMPIIRQITSTNEDRAQKEFGRSGSVLLLLVGIVALMASSPSRSGSPGARTATSTAR